MALPPSTPFTVSEICELAIAVYEQFKYWLKRAETATSESEKIHAERKYTEHKDLLTKITDIINQYGETCRKDSHNLQKQN